jgi:hypothetical protein
MASVREGFDLFSKFGRKYFFRRGLFGDKWARKYVLNDTFGRYVCKAFGHSKKTFLTDEKETICLRCFRRTQ